MRIFMGKAKRFLVQVSRNDTVCVPQYSGSKNLVSHGYWFANDEILRLWAQNDTYVVSR